MSLNVTVKGRSIDQYKHNNNMYIEGRQGSEYELTYYNSTSYRVKVVLSVDGLNVISGDNDWSRGYIVEPWQTISIPGWSKDPNNVAKFVFSSVKNSYNEHNISGDVNNVGVIGAKVFKELVYPEYKPLYFVANDTPILRGIEISAMYSSAQLSSSASVGVKSEQEVGTAWGDNKDFKTKSVYFNAESTEYLTEVIYYDSKKNLQRMGIEFKKEPKVVVHPNPFPGYCQPPISKR